MVLQPAAAAVAGGCLSIPGWATAAPGAQLLRRGGPLVVTPPDPCESPWRTGMCAA